MTARAKPIRVAQIVNSDLRPYRLPLLERLAEGGEIDLTVYAGQSVPGSGAPVKPLQPPVPIIEVTNRHWPGRGRGVWWQSGVLSVLTSDAEVIIVPEIVHNLTLWLIRLLHGVAGKRLVVTGFFFRHRSDSGIGAVHAWLRRRFRASADALIAYSDRGKRECVAEGVPGERVFVSNNTLDVERLRSAGDSLPPEEVHERRCSLGLEGSRVLLYVGRLLAPKHVEVAVRMMSHLRRQIPKVSLVVVGEGPEGESLRQLAEGLPVIFVGPEYDERELAFYFRMADLVVLPGRVGLTSVHALAYGVPCVTSVDPSVFQSPEFDYLEDGVNARILPRLDERLFANEICLLLQDDVRLQRLRDGAFASSNALSMDAMATAYIHAVRTAVA